MADKPGVDPTKTWANKARNIIREKRPITAVSGSSARNYYGVYKFKPDRDKDLELIISGNEPMAALQMSLLLAFDDLLAARLGNSSVDFDKWTKDFEEGFKLFEHPTHKSDIQKSSASGLPWGELRENRPRILELKRQNNSPGYKVVEFWPSRDDPSESYLFTGNYSEIITKIEQQWHLIRLMREYSIGEFLGMPINDWLRQSVKRLTLNIVLSLHQSPPFIRNVNIGGKLTQISTRQVSIPYPNRTALKYSTLRNVCGGSSGLGYGHYHAIAYLTPDPVIQNKRGAAQMWAHGATAAEAQSNLDKFLTLTEGHLLDRSEGISSKLSKQKDPKGLFLRNYRVYPAYVFVENAAMVAFTETQSGRAVQGGRKVSNKSRLDIWQESEPSGFSSKLRELLRNPVRPQTPSK